MISDILEIIGDASEFVGCGLIEIIISMFSWFISFSKWLISRTATIILTIIAT